MKMTEKNRMTIMRKMIFLLTIFAIVACEKEETKTNTLTDIDGNSYKTVTIGNQTWMAENLRVTKYPDGTKIPNVTECADWQSLGTNAESYCFYENDSKNQYGAYYTYAAAMKACPTGWHLPTNQEWDELKIYLYNNGYNSIEGTALKSTTGWGQSGNGTNKFGFTALPSGRRYVNILSSDCIGGFYSVGEIGYWWSATEYGSSTQKNFAYYRSLEPTATTIRDNYEVKKAGFSVRYVKDKN